VSAIINSHNTKLLTQTETPAKTCNCRNPMLCPLNNNCLASSIVYEAQIHSPNQNIPTKHYIGLSGGPFKQRYNNHMTSLRNENHSKDTVLSKYVWSLKRQNIEYFIKWRIIKHSNTFRRDSDICNLCLIEKYEVLIARDKHLLNKRNELISKCRHHPPIL